MNFQTLAELLQAAPDPPLSVTTGRVEQNTKLCEDLGQLNASEAIYGFVGWVTSRPTVVTWGGDHSADSAVIAADHYIKTNGLPPLGDDYAHKLKVPPEPPG